jgi:hypothetical protein
MRHEKRRFWVVADDGRRFEVIETASTRRAFSARDGHHDVENVVTKFATTAGLSVTPLGNGVFFIVPLKLKAREEMAPN